MIKIKITGLDNLGIDIEKGARQGLGKAMAYLESEVKKKAPSDTGALRRSITSEIDGNLGVVYTPLEYAPYVEYGTGLFAEDKGRDTPWSYKDDEGNWHTTVGQKPHPYMRPALYENIDEIKEIIAEDIIND